MVPAGRCYMDLAVCNGMAIRLRKHQNQPIVSAPEHQQIQGNSLRLRDNSRYAASLRLSVAPMMDWTDTHCRVFHRILAPHARLYTEMVHANAVIHGDRSKLLAMDPVEHPVALQLGGSEPELLARAARIGAEHGFDEINLNCGCPSDRVQAGRFGACLMREPALVADAVAAVIAAGADLAAPVRGAAKGRLGRGGGRGVARLLRYVDPEAAGRRRPARTGAGNGEVPPRRGRRPRLRPLPRLRGHGGRRRLPQLRGARAQCLAAGPVAEGEPHGAAAALRLGLPAEGAAAVAAD